MVNIVLTRRALEDPEGHQRTGENRGIIIILIILIIIIIIIIRRTNLLCVDLRCMPGECGMIQ